jgi:Leucine-rich repeat (LRR) protein
MKLLKALIIFAVVSYSTALKISCTITSYDWNNWGGRKTCDASFAPVTAFSPTVTATEQSSIDFETIKAVKIKNQRSYYLPRGLTKIFPNMKELYVFLSKLTYLSRGDFKSYTELKTISLSQNKLSDIPFDTFDDLINVQEFSLSHNRLTQIPNLKNMKNLKELYLFKNFLQSFTADDFAENTKLEVIWIYGNDLVNIDESIFSYLPNLRVADFSKNDCVDAQVPSTSKKDLENIFEEKCNEIVGISRKTCY